MTGAWRTSSFADLLMTLGGIPGRLTILGETISNVNKTSLRFHFARCPCGGKKPQYLDHE